MDAKCFWYVIHKIHVIVRIIDPSIHDEPQHIYQGEVTLKLLEDMDIASFVIGKETTEDVLAQKMTEFRSLLEKGKGCFCYQKRSLDRCS